MKFVIFLLLSSLTIVTVVAFPGGFHAHANMPNPGQNDNSISAADNGGGSSATATQTDNNIRQPRGLLKKFLGHPDRVVVVERVLVPQYPAYSYRGYGNQYTNYQRSY